MVRPEKESVAVVIRRPDHGREVLTVLRPPDDEDLPSVWGLPAASLRPGESWEDAVRRVGTEKLGVQLEVTGELERGSIERRAYRLQMRLYEARITGGRPVVPQPDTTHTQYSEWRWGTRADLEPAAQRGSLCSQLFLQTPEFS